MQVDLNLEGLTDFKLGRLVKLLEELAESSRSEAFNRFLFWAAREGEREMRGRVAGVPRQHTVSIDTQRLRPGELVFLQRASREWEIEFGKNAIGPLAELFWGASASLLSGTPGSLLPQ
jgi:hypothetical protein